MYLLRKNECARTETYTNASAVSIYQRDYVTHTHTRSLDLACYVLNISISDWNYSNTYVVEWDNLSLCPLTHANALTQANAALKEVYKFVCGVCVCICSFRPKMPQGSFNVCGVFLNKDLHTHTHTHRNKLSISTHHHSMRYFCEWISFVGKGMRAVPLKFHPSNMPPTMSWAQWRQRQWLHRRAPFIWSLHHTHTYTVIFEYVRNEALAKASQRSFSLCDVAAAARACQQLMNFHVTTPWCYF